MFQYASALALAQARGSKLWLDTRALPLLAQRKNVTPRSLEIFDFQITAGIPTGVDLDSWGLDWRVLPPSASWIPGRLWLFAQRAALSVSPPGFKIYSEPSLDFDPGWSAHTTGDQGLYLKGFWQSENYFSNLRRQLIAEFVPSSPLSPELASLRQQITDQRSLVVHIRRGDLVNNRKARGFHGLLPVDYYRSAINSMRQRVDSESILVFTDDENWCKSHLRSIQDLTVIQGSDYPGNSAQHLYTMSAGSAFVIANSSFSWWAAWLSGVSGEHIAAPEPWFAQAEAPNGPVPTSWCKIPVVI